jgi:hypothetical protein
MNVRAVKAKIIAVWNDPQWLAQTSHVFIAATIVFGTVALGHLSPWWGFAGVFLWAVPKEFWWDRVYEKDPLKSSVKDFAFYLASGAVALGACLIWG